MGKGGGAGGSGEKQFSEQPVRPHLNRIVDVLPKLMTVIWTTNSFCVVYI